MAIPRRIGVLLPSTNQVVEPDFNSAVPGGVTVHAERLWLEGPSAPGGGDGIELMDMNADIDRAARYVASAGSGGHSVCLHQRHLPYGQHTVQP